MLKIILGTGEIEKIVFAMEFMKEKTGEEFDELFISTLAKMKEAREESKKEY